MNRYVPHYEYITDEASQAVFYGNPGITGQPMGVLTTLASFPCLPGHVANAYTYRFPVKFHLLPDVELELILQGDSGVEESVVRGAQQLEKEGCRAVFGDCGFFGHFQKKIAEAIHVPAFMSSIMLIPWVLTSVSGSETVGVLTADSTLLTYSLFEACGVSPAQYTRCRIVGAEGEREFARLRTGADHYDVGEVRNELVRLASGLVEQHPDVGAFVLECTDMTQHAHAIHARTGRAVFDAVTMINQVYLACCPKPYEGFC